MDAEKYYSPLDKFVSRYTLWTSWLMLVCAAYYFQFQWTNVNVFSSVISAFPKTENLVNGTIGFVFFFGYFNILICGMVGVAMLFIKGKQKLGVLGLFAALSFSGMLYHIGDAF